MERRGFTLVELLVVIAIIAMLVALLIPAVQASREMARRTQCTNSFKQVALATLNYVSTNERLPALVDPDFQFGRKTESRRSDQVSWRFTILPFLEDEAGLYDTLQQSHWQPRLGEIPADPRNVASSPSHLCPSTEGTPNYGAVRIEQVITRDVSRDNRIVFDGLPMADNAASSGVFSMAPGRASACAWTGPAGQACEIKAMTEIELLSKPAKLAWITDGTSKTILVRELAGRPRRIEGGEKKEGPTMFSWLGHNLMESKWLISLAHPPINFANQYG